MIGTGFKYAAYVVAKPAREFANYAWNIPAVCFVRKNPGAQAALLAMAGDLLVPLFRDGWSYGATAVFCVGEASLFAYSKNLSIRGHTFKRNPWMPAIAYGCFAVGMELLTHSIGVAGNPLLKLNLHAFSRLDVFWTTVAGIKAASFQVRKLYPDHHKLERRLHKAGDKGIVIAGMAATFLHLPGIGGSVGLSGPFNVVTLGGHTCWLAADYIMGGVQKVGGMVGRRTEWVLERKPIRYALGGPELTLLKLEYAA